jgi:hypothetical protein
MIKISGGEIFRRGKSRNIRRQSKSAFAIA